MSIFNLTNKEKTVFFSIVKYPELNDIELSEKTGIKRSTVTAIKNRLKAEKFYNTFVIPNLPALGVKVLSILYGKFNPKYPRQERQKAGTFESKLSHPELVFLQTSDSESFGIYMSTDLTEIRKAQDYFILDYEAHDFYDLVKRVFYPIELCDIYSFFNFSSTVARLFSMKDDKPDIKPIWKGHSPINLTNTEKKIFHSIVKYPEANNIEISKKTGKTRSTVSKIRKRLLDEGLIRIVNMPTLDKLGCELMVSYHSAFNPKFPKKDRTDGTELMAKIVTPILHINGDIESSGLVAFKNYTEYTELSNKVLSFYKEKNYIQESPFFLFFPFQQLKWTKLDFASLTEKLLFGEKKTEKAIKAKAAD